MNIHVSPMRLIRGIGVGLVKRLPDALKPEWLFGRIFKTSFHKEVEQLEY